MDSTKPTQDQLKSAISNADMDIYISRKDYKYIQDCIVEDFEFDITIEDVKTAVKALENDPYYGSFSL